jgi:hypothetical protein
MQAYVHLQGIGPTPCALSQRTAEQYAKLAPELKKHLDSSEMKGLTDQVKQGEGNNSKFVQLILDTHLPPCSNSDDEEDGAEGENGAEEASVDEADYNFSELTKVQLSLWAFRITRLG